MILPPTSASVGIAPHGAVVRMVNKHTAALAIGDVVCNSFDHSFAAYTDAPTTEAALRLSPMSCVKLAEGDVATSRNGFIGVVVGLGSYNGAVDQDVEVQFGGISDARLSFASGTVALGTALYLSDIAGRLANSASTTAVATDFPVAIALATGTTGNLCKVLMKYDIQAATVLA